VPLKTNQWLDWEPNARLSALPTVATEVHRSGMRNFAAGVSIITSRHDGLSAGLTATAVCSVTADPPRLVVFVNKGVLATDLIIKSGALCANLLSGEQEDVARAFAGMVPGVRGEDRFGYGRWSELLTGAPVLENALVSFDCRVTNVYDESTHQAFLCEVLATQQRKEGDALIYLNGAFHAIPLCDKN